MADVERNLEVWDETWDWSREGDEWSDWWGGTPALWHGALLPRIHAYVPTGKILEIAPGHGRWTQYLKDLGEELVVVDLAERCIDHCRQRFSEATNIEYHVNDGSSLEMVDDESIDLAFSFDSLVHVERETINSYLAQLATKLTPDGVGFVHHSNIGAYAHLTALARRLPDRLRRPLVRRGVVIDLYAWRAESMTAELFAEQCDRVGLLCFCQEKISWESGHFLTDAISVFARQDSRWARPNVVVRNPLFRMEAKRMAKTYADPGRALSSE